MRKFWIWLFEWHIDNMECHGKNMKTGEWRLIKRPKLRHLAGLICKFKLCERGEHYQFHKPLEGRGAEHCKYCDQERELYYLGVG